MKRPPLIPTLIVLLAVAAMIGLGVWQLHRAEWKDGLLARYATARAMPSVSFPIGASDEELLFRRSSVVCLQPVSWSIASGRNRQGGSGWRHLVACRTGAEGPGATIDMGWSPAFDVKPDWKGGRVIGTIGPRPDHRSVLSVLTGARREPGVMLVADEPAPGLSPSATPSLDDIPNNHRAYAVQWFIFAFLALAIYAIALRRRGVLP